VLWGADGVALRGFSVILCCAREIDSRIGSWGINFPFVLRGGWVLQVSRGCVVRILQNFAAKLWNVADFVVLFRAVVKFWAGSKFCL
jgi:hypothetical protein